MSSTLVQRCELECKIVLIMASTNGTTNNARITLGCWVSGSESPMIAPINAAHAPYKMAFKINKRMKCRIGVGLRAETCGLECSELCE